MATRLLVKGLNDKYLPFDYKLANDTNVYTYEGDHIKITMVTEKTVYPIHGTYENGTTDTFTLQGNRINKQESNKDLCLLKE